MCGATSHVHFTPNSDRKSENIRKPSFCFYPQKLTWRSKKKLLVAGARYRPSGIIHPNGTELGDRGSRRHSKRNDECPPSGSESRRQERKQFVYGKTTQNRHFGTKMGVAPSVVIYDELGQSEGRDLLDALDTAMGQTCRAADDSSVHEPMPLFYIQLGQNSHTFRGFIDGPRGFTDGTQGVHRWTHSPQFLFLSYFL
jgi:hypothetical protein